MTRAAADRDNLDEAESLLAHLESVEAKLRTVQDGLMRSHRLATLGTMASILAHEFNNILTPVVSYCQLAKSNPADAAMVAKALDRSLAGAERAAHICNSILGFARHGAPGNGESASATCRLADAVAETFACLGRDPARDGIKLELAVPEDLWLAIPAVDMQQVLLNLVLNARQAMKAGRGGRLSISATPGNMNSVHIEVTDTGLGIPTAIRGRVFEPFVTQRVNDDHSQADTGGTGLGLAICRDLIQRAGGTIEIMRSDAGGTVFRITLGVGQPPQRTAGKPAR